MGLWLSLLPVFLDPLSAQPLGQEFELEEDRLSIYVNVLDARGQAVSGLPADAFEVLENGHPQTLESFRELSFEGPFSGAVEERRWLVLFFAPDLGFRELFRAKRVAVRLAGMLDERRDALAVMRGSRLSAFRGGSSIQSLIRYFGVEDGLRTTSDEPDRPSWLRLRMQERQEKGVVDGKHSLHLLITQGAQGRPLDLLGSLKHLVGRKVLIFFGTRPPSWDEQSKDESGYLDPQIVGDAGFTLLAVNPAHFSQADDASLAASRRWARESGGDAVSLSRGVRNVVDQLQLRLSRAYWLRYRIRGRPDCRFRRVQLRVSASQAAQLVHRPGYFATQPGVFPLADRTLQTVAGTPAGYQDFPLGLGGKVDTAPDPGVAHRGVQMLLSFPLGAVRMEEPEPGQWRQLLILFVGVFNSRDRLLGGIYRELVLRANQPGELNSLLSRTFSLNETVEVDSAEAPAYLQAIVIAGRNRQISVQSHPLGGN